MSIIRFHQVSLSLTEDALLDSVSLQIEAKQRVAVIGRNGAGKSTLLKLIAGRIEPDSGNIERQTTRIATMEQVVPQGLTGTVYDWVKQAQPRTTDWDSTHKIDQVIDELQLSPTANLEDLSGGQLRRCLLAQALVSEPDVLLLDEPTNHLDLSSIKWLEKFLQQSNLTVIFITHDRAFLQRVANGIIEIDRGRIISWSGDYAGFQQHKEQQLAAEATHNALFDKKLAQEEAWIRQGIKARRTRNEGRVRALKKLRNEYSARRTQQGTMKLQQQSTATSGKQVFVAESIGIEYEGKKLFTNFSCIVARKDKIGIIGPNGCGKTTLIQCLLGNMQPNTGTVKQGTKLSVAYFDQHRGQLDQNRSLIETVGEGSDSITIGGKQKHIIGYLQDFLFTPAQARGLVRGLSGGECNRLLLAKLFAKPSNLLVLDEPTNDLDLESLELLEEYLLDYDGTVLLKSHDRELLNRVVTSTWVFGDNGDIIEYAGGYDDYQQATTKKATKTKVVTSTKDSVKSESDNLSYAERKELNRLPDKITKLEAKIEHYHQQMAAADFYKQDAATIQQKQDELTDLEEKLSIAYARWEELLDN